jgi:hypothetical protein
VRPARTDKTNITAYARPLIASALLAGGLVQLAVPVFAQSVPVAAAASSISNTATASYEDPLNSGTTISTVSNTVNVTVAKVAGIVVTGKGYVDNTTADAFAPGDVVYSNFDVTNTGNDGVKFRVPSAADVSGNTTFVQVEYSTDGTNWTAIDKAANPTGVDSPIIAINGVLKVRVKLTINSNALSGSDIVTTLGNTSAPGLFNVERGVAPETLDSNNRDIYTVDVLTAGGGVALGGNAANNVREASAKQTTQVNVVKQAVPTVTLTNGAITPNATASATKDDVPYTISVTVPTTNPATGAATADLAPTAIKLATTAGATAGTDVNRVIISNPLPAGSTFNSITAPAGWTPIYAITSPVVGTPTVWSITPPSDLTTVKQVGFIYEPTTATTTTATPATAGTSLSSSTTAYSGFAVNITTGSLGTVPNTVSIDGTTPGTTTAAHGDATTPIVTKRTAAIGSIYNGPAGVPQAEGPGNDINTDFTNKSMKIAAADAVRDASGVLNVTSTTSIVTFSNTVENATNVAGNVYLLPTAPATKTDLPQGTIITIKKSDNTGAHTYAYNQSTGTFTTASTGLPLTLAVTGLGTNGYIVEVTLPTGQAQLKGYPVPVTAFTTSDATFLASSGTTVVPATVAAANKNTTIDRVYTGYIDLVKEVRALDADTQQDSTTIPYLSTSADLLTIKATPGKFIQYRVRAVNVSTAADTTAVGSQLLTANKINMVEDGVFVTGTGIGSNPNNWSATTSHVADSAKTLLDGSALGTITFYNGLTSSTTQGTTVTKYVADFGTTALAPNKTASFSFVRKVNKPDPQ